MITLPGFMPSTASAVTSFGAGRPGTSAVVITTSKPLIASVSACCCWALLLGGELARVAALAGGLDAERRGTSRPSDSTCSATSGRTS